MEFKELETFGSLQSVRKKQNNIQYLVGNKKVLQDIEIDFFPIEVKD